MQHRHSLCLATQSSFDLDASTLLDKVLGSVGTGSEGTAAMQTNKRHNWPVNVIRCVEDPTSCRARSYVHSGLYEVSNRPRHVSIMLRTNAAHCSHINLFDASIMEPSP